MKIKLLIIWSLIFSTALLAQPAIQWKTNISGSSYEVAGCVRPTSDGGYIAVGGTASNDGDISGNHGLYDVLVVKTDANGNVMWKKVFGGSDEDDASSVEQTDDGGYIIAGSTQSTDGDAAIGGSTYHSGSGQFGNSTDYWLVKLDANGNIQWQKAFGGSDDEEALNVKQTKDRGFIIVGYTNSNDGDVTNNHGGTDWWVVKLDNSGNIQWQRTYGGTGNDQCGGIEQTIDGGYILAGYLGNNNLSNYGNAYIIKLYPDGSSGTYGGIEWQQTYGNTGNDYAKAIIQTSDGGYIFAGLAGISEWVVKLNSDGSMNWSNIYNSYPTTYYYNKWDFNWDIQETSDQCYIVMGNYYTSTNDFDWDINKLDKKGKVQWNKTIGGSQKDEGYSIRQTDDCGYIVAGYSQSNDGDFGQNKGGSDFWIIKLNWSQPITGVSNIYVGNTTQFSNPIAGTTYVTQETWSSNNNNIATVNTKGVVKGVSQGTATITYTATTIDGCSISVTKDITIMNLGFSCLMPGYTTLPDISGPLVMGSVIKNGGVYYIKSDLIIIGDLTFKDAEVYFDRGINLYVTNTGTLNVLGSHLTTCDGQWNGINVVSGGKVNIDEGSNGHSSLIEDAAIVINYDDKKTGSAYKGNIIGINNSIFNRNNTGVQIQNYTKDYNAAAQFPFSIKNSIFTCRDVPFNSLHWDNVDIIKNSKGTAYFYPNIPATYNAPYIDDSKYRDSYLKGVLTGYTTEKPQAGIVLNNVADANGLSSIMVGDPGSPSNINTTIFDNMNTGIDATQCNLAVRNCTFQNPALLPTAIGINVNNDGNNTVDINTNAGTPTNAFFDMYFAINTMGGKNVTVSNCDIRSNRSIAKATSNNGAFGILVSNINFNAVNIESNNIYNIQNAVYVLTAKDKTPFASIVNVGNIIVNNNTIKDEITPTGNSAKYIGNAITMECLYVNSNNNLSCNNNTIEGAFNGIRLSNWKANNVEVKNNTTIKLKNDPNAQPADEYYGISLEGGSSVSNVVEGNSITGSYDFTASNNTNQSGVLLSMQSNATVQCNNVSSNMHGFRFYGSNPQTKWWDNTMNADNQFGMTVEEGFIGQQGTNDPKNNNFCGSNNSWSTGVVGVAGWDGNGRGQYMTKAINSDLTQSRLVILDKATNPELNPNYSWWSSDPYTLGYKYTFNDGALQQITSQNGTCDRCAGATNYRLSNTKFDAILEEIAQGIVNLPADEAIYRLKVMQEQLYEMLKEDPEIGKNSSSLQQFIYDNQMSSLDFIHLIGKFIAEGNMDYARILLNNWDNSSDDRVDESYRVYYEWVVKMYKDREWKPAEEDIRRLYDYANRCPLKDGVVVYAFRNLYNAITQRINKFENNCDGQLAGRGVKPLKQFIRLKPKPVIEVNPISSTILYPNPADNIVSVKADNIKSFIISDATGKVVLEATGNGLKQFNTNKLVSGLYIVKSINTNGLQTSSKLIVQH